MTTSTMEEGTSVNRNIVSKLLKPVRETVFKSEEDQHPWRTRWTQTFDRPFLRLWDHFSGSQPDENGYMKSRAERDRLDTRTSRIDSLTIHINNRVWTPTPYISFTTSPSNLKDLVTIRARSGTRGPHTLTVVDPNTRVRNGLPVLHVADELKHYGIDDPSPESNPYHTGHYICLWEVTATEVVGHWNWNDLARNENWYEEEIMTAFRQFRKTMVEHSLSTLFSGLSVTANRSGPTNFFGGSDTSSEELICDHFYDGRCGLENALDDVQGENDSDTDGELEQATVADA